MADDGRVSYRDIITPDDSITKLIAQLEELNKQFGTMSTSVKAGAESMARALKAVSGATAEGRRSIESLTAAADRQKRAMEELAFAKSSAGKATAALKAQIADENRQAMENFRRNSALEGSYDRVERELKDLVAAFKALNGAERAEVGVTADYVSQITKLTAELDDLKRQMNEQIAINRKLAKAKEELAFAQSKEGKEYRKIKQQTKDVNRNQREYTTRVLNATGANKRYTLSIREANEVDKLRKQLSKSVAGSYDALSAQYRLNMIELNKLSQEERKASTSGAALEQQTREIYEQMKRMQEDTGKYTLSVGQYQNMWAGLNYSVQQVVRELPTAAVSLNHLFLAVSNNIPILVDDIRAARLENERLAKSGKKGIPVWKQIGKSLFSWQTALVALLAVFAMNGDAIIAWAKKAIFGADAAMSYNEALKSINEQLKENDNSYGDNVALLKKMSAEYKGLSTQAEKDEYLKIHTDDIVSMNIALEDAIDLENILVKNTEAIVTAMGLRAKAASAGQLAAEAYSRELQKTAEAETLEKEGPSKLSRKLTPFTVTLGNNQLGRNLGIYPTLWGGAIIEAREEAEKAKTEGDRFLEIQRDLEKQAAELWKFVKDESGGSGGGDKLRDLTDTIERNKIRVNREYRESVLESLHDEVAQRKQAAIDEVRNENDKLNEMLRMNKKYVDLQGEEYKELTEDQKKEIDRQNKALTAAIANNNRRLAVELRIIAKEQAIAAAQIQRAVSGSITAPTGTAVTAQSDITPTQSLSVSADPSSLVSSLEAEKKLRTEALDLEYSLIIEQNRRLKAEGDKSAREEEDILKEQLQKKLEIWSEFDQRISKVLSKTFETDLALAVTDKEKYEVEMKILKAKQAQELAANNALDAEERLDSALLKQLHDRQQLELTAKYELDSIKKRLDAELMAFEAESISSDAVNIKKAENDLAYTNAKIEKAKTLGLKEGDAEYDALLAEAKKGERNLLFMKQDYARKVELAVYESVVDSNKWLNVKRLQLEVEMWEEKIRLAKEGSDEYNEAIANRDKAQRALTKEASFTNAVAQDGLLGASLSFMGKKNDAGEFMPFFNEESIGYIQNATNIFIDQLGQILDAEVQLAEKEAELAQQRVDNAQKAYDAEIEARNNGYANNVATAKKELQQEQLNQQKKQRLLEQAQKRQEVLNTIVQASSLITASAQLWQAFSGIPIVGPALAIAAMATMWGSFAYAKVKAFQVAGASQEYGEGGLEFLEGGSHASGNDIDLGVKNKRKKKMRAEGGEALAIINKRKTRKYRKVLPSVIESLNKGTFEDKYLRAFDSGNGMSLSIVQGPSVDLSRVESDIQAIRKQNETKYYSLPNGAMIIQKGNVKRTIRN